MKILPSPGRPVLAQERVQVPAGGPHKRFALLFLISPGGLPDQHDNAVLQRPVARDEDVAHVLVPVPGVSPDCIRRGPGGFFPFSSDI